jgi:hypothetical protein
MSTIYSIEGLCANDADDEDSEMFGFYHKKEWMDKSRICTKDPMMKYVQEGYMCWWKSETMFQDSRLRGGDAGI